MESCSNIKAWQDKEDKDNYFLLHFETNEMYNDFGNTDNYGIFSINPPDNKYHTSTINYSGLMTCMCCGENCGWYDNTEAVICEDCEPSTYCYCCGERVNANDAIEVDGEWVCEDCYNDLHRCMCCEDAHFEDDLTLMFVGHIENQTINVDYDEHYICSECLANKEYLKYLGDTNIRAKTIRLDGSPYYGVAALLIEEDDLNVEAKRIIANDPYSTIISNHNYKISHCPETFYISTSITV